MILVRDRRAVAEFTLEVLGENSQDRNEHVAVCHRADWFKGNAACSTKDVDVCLLDETHALPETA
jgi:hypothetical protein